MASGILPLALPAPSDQAENLVQDYARRGETGQEGRFVDEFEHAMAGYLGVKHAIGTRSHIASLHLALVALGVGRYASQRQTMEDHAVLVPSFADVAVANAVSHRQAVPVFCDIDPQTWCITAEEIESALHEHAKRGATSQPRAVICVHVNGYPCQMDRIMEVARSNNLYVVEDATEALGGECGYTRPEGRYFQKMGTIGDIGCFSFADDSQVTAVRGGMCVTNSDLLAFSMRMYRDYHVRIDEGGSYYESVPFEHRMADLQAAAELNQVRGINKEASRRRWLCGVLRIALRSSQPLAPGQSPRFYYHRVNTEEEAANLIASLKDEGIESRAFHTPIHLQKPYADGRIRLPVAESLFGILLPLHEGVMTDHIDVMRHVLAEAATV